MQGNASAWSAEYWDFFIRDARRLQSPLYIRLSEGTRTDETLCMLAALARPGQPPANMLFGAVHYLLLRGADHPLRRHYRTLGDATAADDPFPRFRDFCLSHRDGLAALIAERVTNTNEVGRCALLHPAFAVIAAEAPGPLHLIELGPSAGLNLRWDEYGYRYLRSGEAFRAGAPEAALVLDCRIGARVPPLDRAAAIGLRVGIDLHPVDLSRSEDRDWLRALVWPDHPERMKRLELALDAREARRPDIRAGDVLECLTAIAAEAPRTGTLCIVHTMVTYQFSREQKALLDDLMLLISLRRPVWRLSMEWDEDRYPLLLTRYHDGAQATRLLGHCSGHGGDLDWQA